MAGWLPDPNEKKFPKTSHVGFGLVLGADGKRFQTRSTEVIRLGDLLDEAKSRSKLELVEHLSKKGKRYNYGISFAFLITFQVKHEVRFCSGKLVHWTDEELEKTSKELGYGAVKYVPRFSFLKTNLLE
jgi:arginyl-tRNA synthetase